MKTYEEFARLIKRPVPGEGLSRLARTPGIRQSGNAATLKLKVLEGKPLAAIVGDEEIVELVVPDAFSEHEVYDALYAGKITIEKLRLQFHLMPRGEFIITTGASNRFIVSLFHGGPVGSVRKENESEPLWFWLKEHFK